ncbi:MAG: hypothetical protein H6Q17_2720 [Bacteroidetes bacterium]|jgi:hypothetical protein|nr:hypothetical protein [Bacteroidota bacterium]
MKKLIFFFSSLSIFLFASCNLEPSSSNYTPVVTITSFALNGQTSTTYDTLTVGTVLTLYGYVSGVTNTLDSVRISNDTSYSTLTFTDLSSIDTNVLSNSKTDISKGFFYLHGFNIYSMPFTLVYIPTQVKKDGKITFQVYSNSSYSPLITTFPTPSKN